MTFALCVVAAACGASAPVPAARASVDRSTEPSTASTDPIVRASVAARAETLTPVRTLQPPWTGVPAVSVEAAQVPAPLPTPAPTLTPVRTFTNPVIARDFADPDVMRSGDWFYAFATNTGGINVQAARSRDLVAWEALPDALPVLPAWARAGRTWAPDVTAVGNGFVLYFVAQHAASGRQCIGAATATSPAGPFHALPAPLVCPLEAGGAIDPASFVDIDGGRYLIWKNDGNCCAVTTWIYAQPMMPDGLSFAAGPTPLIKADRSWEGGIVEAPIVYRRGGVYHLFYSANGYGGAAYAIGHASGASLGKPFAKDASPVAKSGAGIVGPGGQDLVALSDGSTWFAYHSWAGGGSYRELDLGPLSWDGDRPVFTPSRAPQPVP